MSTNVLEKNITDLFGLEEMSEEDRNVFLEDIGNLILESSVTRLMADMDDEGKKTFESFISEIADREDMVETLEKEYPALTGILEEEVAAFKKEAIAVLGADAVE